MITTYILSYNKDYSLKLLINDEEFDYYTDITLELSINTKNKIIFKDNLLFLKNVLYKYIDRIDNYILDNRLNEKKLGLLLNEYYYDIYENIENDNLIKDEKGLWIGEKYCCFSTPQYATWLYKLNGKIMLKVTPIFTKFDEDTYFDEYLKFIEDYADIFNVEIMPEQFENIFKTITELNRKFDLK